VFPEQAANWEWIAERLRGGGFSLHGSWVPRASCPCIGETPVAPGTGETPVAPGTGEMPVAPGTGETPVAPDDASTAACGSVSRRPAKVLNLFAYTGGSTLAAAACGAEVVHVDAARNTIDRARRNAELSGMAQMPIRWIAEDAMKFVKRELKRGNGYDAVILDPPSYGHGPRGEVWRLAKHLPRLLRLCGELTAGRRRFMLLTCHTPGYGPPRLEEMMADALEEAEGGTIEAGELTIRAATGRQMPGGVVVQWESSG